MKNNYIDLHVHTTYSDGTFTPAEVVEYAHKVGLKAIAITDHDITDGIPQAIETGKKLGVEIIPGIELSAEFGDSGAREIHILGYFINWENQQFQDKLKILRKARTQRARTIWEKLANCNVLLDKNELFQDSNEKTSIGRLHFAKQLIKEGFVKNVSDAFNKYLAYGKPAYVPKMRLNPDEAIQDILRSGGVPVLAHPYIGKFNNKNILKSLIQSGLQGIEVWHTKHSQIVTQNTNTLANELELITTGGSDCHGGIIDGKALMGHLKIPYSILTALKNCKEKLDKQNQNILE